MAIQIDTPFKAYEFTESEIPIARTFTELQTMHLRTELSAYATLKLQLDPTSPTFLLDHAKFQGHMESIEHLLAISEDSKNALAEALSSSIENQKGT